MILFPHVSIALIFSTAWELLVAVILSAQCTDIRVNAVTPKLFRVYPTVFSVASADIAQLEKLIYSTGFYHAKARHIIGAARMIVSLHQGVVPRTMKELLQLPGVGRKTANVILHEIFGIADGITVDTHVRRLSLLFGFTKHRAGQWITVLWAAPAASQSTRLTYTAAPVRQKHRSLPSRAATLSGSLQQQVQRRVKTTF
jgi:endonuclease-3